MKVYKNISQLCTLESAYKKDGRKLLPDDLSIIEDGSIVFDNDKIHWVGKTEELPSKYQNIESEDCSNLTIVPEIVDSHTHLVFGGNRSKEYSMRLNGADYQAIAEAGGGILSTMTSTIALDRDELFNRACKRINSIASYGIGTIEIKSGYALTYEHEKIISEVIHNLKVHYAGKVKIHNTFLAAHAVPKSFNSSSDYIQKVVIPLLNELAQKNIVDSVDIFHEEGYFDENDVRSLFEECKKLNIPRRMHADEFNDNDGASIAVDYDCLSCDHLLCTSDKGMEKLASSNTVASILPGTALFLGKPFANARKFLDAGCKVAFASDYNPGSCHCDNLLLITSITAKVLNVNIAELWCGITLNAAHSLNFKDQGAIIPGLKPCFSKFKCNTIDEITYNWGKNLFAK